MYKILLLLLTKNNRLASASDSQLYKSNINSVRPKKHIFVFPAILSSYLIELKRWTDWAFEPESLLFY
jgi:hypothetical protein